MNKDVCIYTKLLPCVGYRSLSGTFLHTVGISPHYYGNRQRMKECVRAREKERRKKRKCAACINYSFSLTQTYMAWLQLLTCTHTLSILHTHTHAQFAFHSWNAICESPTASTLHRQHYSTVLTVRPCRKYKEKERARQEEGKWRRAESRWGKEDNSTLAVFLT